MINSFKKVAVVATLFTVVSSLTPKSAEARLFKPSGTAVNESDIEFELDADIIDSDLDLNKGLFKGAIKNFERRVFTDPTDPNNGTDKSILGNIAVSRLTLDSSGKIADFLVGDPDNERKVTPQELTDIFSNEKQDGFNIDFTLGNVIRYDVTLEDFKIRTTANYRVPQLTWFVQSTDDSLINNLSGLDNFQKIFGILGTDSPNAGTFDLTLNRLPEPTKVPEPNNILGMIAFGAGTILLKFKKSKSST